jgi:hypothetical protein
MNETVEDTRRRRTSGILTVAPGAPDIVEAIARNAGSKSHLAGVGYEAYLPRTKSIPAKSNSNL